MKSVHDLRIEMNNLQAQMDIAIAHEKEIEQHAKNTAQKAKKLATLLLGNTSEELIEAQAKDFMKLSEKHLDDAIERHRKSIHWPLKFDSSFQATAQAARAAQKEIKQMERQSVSEPPEEEFNTDEMEFNEKIPIYVEAIQRLHRVANYLENHGRTDLAMRTRKVAEQLTEKVEYHI